MKIIKKISFLLNILIFFLTVYHNVYAEDDAGSRASFTRSGWVGGRYIAMGKAAEVIADDVYSIYWNPAGLRELMYKKNLTSDEIIERAKSGNINNISEDDLVKFSEDEYSKFFFQIGISTAMLDADREAGFAGTAFNLFNGVLGIAYYGIQARDIESRDEQGNLLGNEHYIASTGFISYGWSMGIASVGVSLKALNERIGDINYFGMGSDIGTQIELVPLVKIGFLVQDAGTWLKPAGKYENIENKYDFAMPVFRLSASITNRSSNMVAAVSGIKKLEQDKYEVNFGFQYNFTKYSSLYLGINNSNFSTGISVRFFDTELTYAFTFDRINTGYNNIISLTLVI